MRCNKADKLLEVQIGSDVIKCEQEGEIDVQTTAYSGKLKCPNYNDMCEEVLEHRCPMDCYGQGYCMANQTCQCFSGFSGTDCNEGLPADKNTFVTDYDLRNEKGSDRDGSSDDDEKDGSDGQNGDNKEEEQPVDPKVKGLEKKLAKLERSLDNFSLQKNKFDFRKEITLLC